MTEHEGINTNYWKIPILHTKYAKNTSHLTFFELTNNLHTFSRVRCWNDISPLLTLITMESPSWRWGVVRSVHNTSPLHCIDIQHFKCQRWGVRCFLENSFLKIDFTLHADNKSTYSVWYFKSKSKIETSQDFTQTSHLKRWNLLINQISILKYNNLWLSVYSIKMSVKSMWSLVKSL